MHACMAIQKQAHLHVMQLFGLTAFCPDAGQLNGGNNVLNPYVNSNVNASSVAQQLVSGATAAGQLARSVSCSDTLALRRRWQACAVRHPECLLVNRVGLLAEYLHRQ